MCEPCFLNLTVYRTVDANKDNVNAQLRKKKTKMFKMARDPFDISRWNRNFYLRIKGFPFKGILCQVFWFFTMLRIWSV